MTYKVVGKRIARYDGLKHVTAETRYIDDIYLPDILKVKVYRSPVHKGIVKSVDTSNALQLDGVVSVITYHDVPNNRVGLIPDQEILAEHIRYKGQPIAAVAAVNEDVALEATRLISAEIEEQEPVFDPIEAMKEGSPQVRPEGNLYMFGDRPYRKVIFGDIKKGFNEADFVLEGEYLHPCHEHAPLETHVSLAVPEANGKITVHSVAQGLMRNLRQVAEVLKIDDKNIEKVNGWSGRIKSNFINSLGASDLNFVGGVLGGGFGGKNDAQLDCITSLLALKTGQPVKWKWTREEETLYSTYRGPWIMKFKDGVKNDGRIVAREIQSIRDAGAYTTMGVYVVDKHSFLASGPYNIPNVSVKGYLVYTNKVPSDAMRGFGITPSSFATELQMDKIAERLGMDPWEIRFINAFRNGDKTATRVTLDSVHLIECMKSVARQANITLPEKLMKMSSIRQGERA